MCMFKCNKTQVDTEEVGITNYDNPIPIISFTKIYDNNPTPNSYGLVEIENQFKEVINLSAGEYLVFEYYDYYYSKIINCSLPGHI